MLTDCTVHALIVAAGKGSRFGSKIPKQYLTLDSYHKAVSRQSHYPENIAKTVLQMSVAKLAGSQFIDECHLVIARDDSIAETLDWAMPIHLSLGGSERWQSVKHGVAEISKNAAKNDLILIHDAARPCVLPSDIDKVIEVAIHEKYGAILAVPVADTLKQVSEDGQLMIDKTISRQLLWQSQTPQVFRIGALQQVLQLIEENGWDITDEASAFEMMNYPIKIVQGCRTNMKLTFAGDLPLLQAILINQLSIVEEV